MSYRIWMLALSIGIVLIFPVVAQHLDPTPDQQHQNDAGANQEDETAYGVFTPQSLGRILAEHHAAINAVATLAIAGFTLTLWLTTRRLWRTSRQSIDAMRTSNETAERALKLQDAIGQAQVRAYLSLGTCKMGELPEKEGDPARQYFDVQLINSGNSPARSVGAVLKCVLTPKMGEDVPFPLLEKIIGDVSSGEQEISFNFGHEIITHWETVKALSIYVVVVGFDVFEQRTSASAYWFIRSPKYGSLKGRFPVDFGHTLPTGLSDVEIENLIAEAKAAAGKPEDTAESDNRSGDG
jgi:hypothetical protein